MSNEDTTTPHPLSYPRTTSSTEHLGVNPALPSAVQSYTVNMDPGMKLSSAESGPGYYPGGPPPAYSDEASAALQAGSVTTVIVQQYLSDTPGQAFCPQCNQECITEIKYTSGVLTILLSFLLFIFGCVLGCCLIPCCVDSCKDVDHFCPECKHHIYKHKRL